MCGLQGPAEWVPSCPGPLSSALPHLATLASLLVLKHTKLLLLALRYFI